MKTVAFISAILVFYLHGYAEPNDSLKNQVSRQQSTTVISGTSGENPKKKKLLRRSSKHQPNRDSVSDGISKFWPSMLGLTVAGIIAIILFIVNKRQKKKLDKKRQAIFLKGAEGLVLNNPISLPKWVIAGESVIGKSHITSGIPCQDSHFVKLFKDDWGIAIVCDGAGSAKNSDRGSKFVATEALPRFFEELVMGEKWIEMNRLPEPDEWQEKATKQFKSSLMALTYVSKENDVELSSLACTAIVIIFSPIGLLIAHIGDGRAGFCNEQGNWQSVVTPHKGVESNQTIFLTSPIWQKQPDLIMSGVKVPECRVITEKSTAFVLMSDGCEQHSFECSKIDQSTGQWSDPNRPYEKFFSPLTDILRQMATSPVTIDIPAKWKQFLEKGNEGLSNESDDKTMILGVLV